MQRTLKDLRRDAPAVDRNCEALRVTPLPFRRPDRTRYVSSPLFPESLEHLRIKCGRFGNAAVEHAKWGAVSSWLMQNPEQSVLSHRRDLAIKAVFERSLHERANNFPNISGIPCVSPVETMSDEQKSDVNSIADATMRDWDIDGQYMLLNSIARTYQSVVFHMRQNPHLPLKETN